jgi:gluconolactonase
VVVAEVPGGPNGLAECADGSLIVCNNGGSFTPIDLGTMILPGPFDQSRHTGGRIERVDPMTGKITRLYDSCDGHPLRGPNDLVLDGKGGFYFTDHGIRHERSGDRTSIYYAKLDGSMIKEVVFPVEAANGIGLSPDGTKLYYAETHTARVWVREIVQPGEVKPVTPFDTHHLLWVSPTLVYLDSLAVDGDGNVCVATIAPAGGVTVISPEGKVVRFVESGDVMTTNICFGGPDLRTAYITRSGVGDVAVTQWPSPGLALHR